MGGLLKQIQKKKNRTSSTFWDFCVYFERRPKISCKWRGPVPLLEVIEKNFKQHADWHPLVYYIGPCPKSGTGEDHNVYSPS